MIKFNFSLGLFASSLVLAILVIAAELFSSFKNFLKEVFTHHWVGKAVIITAVFIVFGFMFRNRNNSYDDKRSWYATLFSLAVVFLFFLLEYIR